MPGTIQSDLSFRLMYHYSLNTNKIYSENYIFDSHKTSPLENILYSTTNTMNLRRLQLNLVKTRKTNKTVPCIFLGKVQTSLKNVFK